jgi:hypothetical protein
VDRQLARVLAFSGWQWHQTMLLQVGQVNVGCRYAQRPRCLRESVSHAGWRHQV